MPGRAAIVVARPFFRLVRMNRRAADKLA